MKKNILMRTNLLVCLIIIVGFLLTAVLSYRANYSASLQNIEEVSSLTSEGIYYQMATTFTKPVNVSLTMANDSLLREYLSGEGEHLDDPSYIGTLSKYLGAYQRKYDYDAVFLISTRTGRYYNFNGLDRVLDPGDPENVWYYELLQSPEDYAMNVDNDEVEGAENRITVFVNCKIHDESGEVIGVVGVGMRITSLQAVLQGYEDKFGVGAFLVDGNGTIEISPQYTGYETVNLFDVTHYSDRVRREILTWKEEGMACSFWITGGSGFQKTDYVVARYLPELEWHLVVNQDTAALVESLNRQLVLTMLVICVIIAVILWVITHVIRAFNRQIVELTQSVEQERRTVFEKATGQLFEDIYELDITANRPANHATEQYFESLGAPHGTPYDKALQIVAEKQVKEEFRQGYLDTFLPENVLRAFRQGRETLRYELMISRDGVEYYWMRITARLVPLEGDGSLRMLVYRQNIDAEKKQEERMRLLAQTDEMTGLFTKAATQRRIEDCLRENPGRLYAFFIFDIDNFKQANDSYGHAFGDGVIREFTRILRGHFRADDLLGRIGGDEFAAFVAAPDETWAAEKAAELSAALDRAYGAEEKNWHLSASIGVSFAPRQGDGFDGLYRAADAALYESKGRGKNSYTISGGARGRD